MRVPFSEATASARLSTKTGITINGKRLEQIALGMIVILAAALRFANLSALGEANHYYTAAVVSMLTSWHNFFFVAAEPGGSVSVDKPPLGLWLQAISGYFLGVNGFIVLLPQILAGIFSVVLIYYLVRRSFGPAAGLLAGLTLAITPVVIATDRNNTIDSTLIFVLLLAAWAFLKSTESPRFRYLLFGAALVGIGFNIKMLEAYLPLPAFYGMYFLGSPERIGKKIAKLAAATILLLVISLSWAVAVDLTPPGQRPYVGSSSDNSEMSLIIGYNGIDRLVGMFGRRGANRTGSFPGGTPPTNPGRNPAFNGAQSPNGGPFNPPPSSNGNNGFSNSQRFQRSPNSGSRPGGPGGMFETGQAGPLRLLIPPLSKEVSWLLPLGLISAFLLAFRHRLSWPIAPQHRALVLWGGWLLTGGIFFSVAGFFHQYYLSTLAPPLAALVGIGAAQIWEMHHTHPWRAALLGLGAAIVTLAFQVFTASAFIQKISWLPFAVLLIALGAAGLVAAVLQKRIPIAAGGYACLVAAMLLTPGIWSGYTNAYASQNQSLPAAYNGTSLQLPNRGRTQVNPQLLNFLQQNTTNVKYLMAVPSSMQGADYVIATGRPVLYMGGFMGQDKVVTAQDLERLVTQGDLRFIYWDARSRGGFGAQSDISAWVTSTCKVVQGFETHTQNSGAPDGTSQGPGFPGGAGGGFNRGGFNAMQVTLYDCAGTR